LAKTKRQLRFEIAEAKDMGEKGLKQLEDILGRQISSMRFQAEQKLSDRE